MKLYDPGGSPCTIEVKTDKDEITKQVLSEYNRKAAIIVRKMQGREKTNWNFSAKSDESFDGVKSVEQ